MQTGVARSTRVCVAAQNALAISRPNRAVPDLEVTVAKAEVAPFAASPTLLFKLRVSNANPAETIHSVVLRCQVQIEMKGRQCSASGRERLCDQSGGTEEWSRAERRLPWTNVSVVVPQFTGVTTVELEVPCTFGFSVAAAKYFNGLADGDIPVFLMLSGTIFYADAAGALGVAPVASDTESRFRLPLKVWNDMMDAYYPNRTWMGLRRELFDQLRHYTVRHVTPTWADKNNSFPNRRAGRFLSNDVGEKLANALLYEADALDPYRPSALKAR